MLLRAQADEQAPVRPGHAARGDYYTITTDPV